MLLFCGLFCVYTETNTNENKSILFNRIFCSFVLERERGDGGDVWVGGVKSDLYTFWPVTRWYSQSVTLKLLIKRSLSKDSWSVRGGQLMNVLPRFD